MPSPSPPTATTGGARPIPGTGTAWVVAEAALNLACVGARPLALVNCLNFGNPEHPEVMWQLSESIDGMGEACRALGIPVIGGNVSLYNESRGRDIDPTPVVGMLGIVDRLEKPPPPVGLVAGSRLVALGPPAGSALDYDVHRRVCGLVASIVNEGLVDGVHDVSDGGLGLALGRDGRPLRHGVRRGRERPLRGVALSRRRVGPAGEPARAAPASHRGRRRGNDARSGRR